MTQETLAKANSLKQKIESVENLLIAMDEKNVLTVGVGMYIPIRYNNEISDAGDTVQELEARCYMRFQEILKEYKKALNDAFAKLQ